MPVNTINSVLLLLEETLLPLVIIAQSLGRGPRHHPNLLPMCTFAILDLQSRIRHAPQRTPFVTQRALKSQPWANRLTPDSSRALMMPSCRACMGTPFFPRPPQIPYGMHSHGAHSRAVAPAWPVLTGDCHSSLWFLLRKPRWCKQHYLSTRRAPVVSLP